MFKYQVDKSQDNGGHYFVNRDGDFISKSYEFSSEVFLTSEEAYFYAEKINDYIDGDEYITSPTGGYCVQVYASKKGIGGDWFELTAPNGLDQLQTFLGVNYKQLREVVSVEKQYGVLTY